ncbi:2-C-methyl-D-erythritol 4-phosphate cytidylyltransferase [Peptoniphilus sp. ING2-D1G]|nr:2-C-methyl-D-erythritol 4-phosphate cytidylyltransferase [Peptoniphilus sp. ING2-D1G]
MIDNNYVCAIVAAAGMGTRMKNKINKQFLEIGGFPILAHTLKKIESSKYVDFIIILIKQSDISYVGSILHKYKINLPFKIVYGGEERQDSVYNGLMNLPEETKIVVTHDGARPNVSVEKVNLAIESVFETGACTLANRVKDTIKVSSNGKTVDYTPNRDELWAVQTPQVFFKDILLKAYKQAYEENYYGTDDCSLVEKTGRKVKLILNDYSNIKITTPEDLVLAEALIEENKSENRNGL